MIDEDASDSAVIRASMSRRLRGTRSLSSLSRPWCRPSFTTSSCPRNTEVLRFGGWRSVGVGDALVDLTMLWCRSRTSRWRWNLSFFIWYDTAFPTRSDNADTTTNSILMVDKLIWIILWFIMIIISWLKVFSRERQVQKIVRIFECSESKAESFICSTTLWRNCTPNRRPKRS
jgi:hypothetical protein